MKLYVDYEAEKELDFDYRETAMQVGQAVLEAEQFPGEAEVNLSLTSDAEIHRVNREFRDIDAPPAEAAGEKSVEELFLDFYAERCGSAPGIQEQALLQFAGEQLRMPEGALLERQARAMLEYALKQEGAV